MHGSAYLSGNGQRSLQRFDTSMIIMQDKKFKNQMSNKPNQLKNCDEFLPSAHSV